jgi:hypothetical protein
MHIHTPTHELVEKCIIIDEINKSTDLKRPKISRKPGGGCVCVCVNGQKTTTTSCYPSAANDCDGASRLSV